MRSIRLLSRGELASMFPEARLLTERFLGLPKSYIAAGRSAVTSVPAGPSESAEPS